MLDKYEVLLFTRDLSNLTKDYPTCTDPLTKERMYQQIELLREVLRLHDHSEFKSSLQ
ncbi:hypothetical protein H8R29_28865 (plasmid) [Priestia megaterium]|uniref:Uncharacterized protein n=1 Tax=Priestia megaterium (strain ATCC 14581 / DSM 32 / CCUG 1817 / JCM 2506 / NBRC 15308 / NCIMB 9376 / NCTC 10342 / NRRL B-14308 / VKM B-512 / Ford 19) TaxID=1348623 RepID=A0A0B6B0Y7_PRIM2|nr:hypothetical protein [Priestia megaterium]AJI25780.1 hypothetical protein BG04_5786 [Priestia megaterium NBRC 15308 = ATCC 14581]AJI25824.1 hypothetical protein BG04_5621 [Priestia megaterium NBRC 15308 = ATCC 14581]KFN08601.1 hypothetical protein DJ91_5812 [Priestia megaterium]MED3809650.1 hypothetical protein [Priestia megaterium]MED4399256.1 hypothetical protein [Priestia megaterium]